MLVMLAEDGGRMGGSELGPLVTSGDNYLSLPVRPEHPVSYHHCH